MVHCLFTFLKNVGAAVLAHCAELRSLNSRRSAQLGVALGVVATSLNLAHLVFAHV